MLYCIKSKIKQVFMTYLKPMMNSLYWLSKCLFSSLRNANLLTKNRKSNRGYVVLLMNKSCIQLTLIFLMSMGFSVDAQEHIHGQGQLLVSQDGKEWHMELSIPAADALGFEHEPETEEQKNALHSLTKRLEKNAGVIEPDGKCSLINAKHSLGIRQADDLNNNEHDHHDIDVEYQFICKAAITQISVKIFEIMPSLSFIEVQWVLENSQGMAKLTRSHPFVEW